MTKLNSLLNYLIKNSFYEEANYLFKLANDQSPEDYLQENYPNIYEVSLNDRKPATAYINIINQLRNKGYSDEEIKGLQINNFQELITKLREEKADPKKEFLDKVKKQVGANISDEELLYAREKGLTPEETIFLVEDKTAHPFSAKVDWAFKFNQNKNKHEDLKDKEITDYQNIDEVDKALTDKITYSAEYMKDFYVGIKSKAEETSEVIYNSLNYVVSHSKSKEAAQWWEQSCVSYNPRTKKVDAGLCTAKHEGNLYDEYYSDGYLVQIITKPSTSNSPSPETNFKDKNYSWNLISLHIYDDGELSQEHGSTVNRLNQDVTPCEIKDALGDEYNKIIEAISGYFNENFKIQISGFDCGEEEDAPNILKLIKKDELNEKDIQFLKDLSSEDYFDYKLDIKFKKDYKDIFDKNYRHIVKNFPETYFENNLGKYRDEKPEYLELFEDALNKLNPLSYFEFKLDEKYRDEKPKYFNIFERNLNEIHELEYFEFKLDEKYRDEKPKYLNIFERNLNKINPIDFFELELDEKYKDQKYFKIIKFKLKHIPASNFFKLKLDEKYRDENQEYIDILEKNLKEIDSWNYFDFKLDEKYAENYPLIHISKHSLREYFEKKFDEKYPEGLPMPSESRRYFKDNYQKDALIPIKDLLKKFYPDDYFKLKLDERYKEYTDILEKNLKEIGSWDYFKYKLDIKFKKDYKDIFDKYYRDMVKNLPETYFENNLGKYRNEKPEYLELFEDALNKLNPLSYFKYNLDEKYKEYTDILRRNKEALYEKYYSKIFEENKISYWAVSDYYRYNVGNFFKKYYPELSEKIDNKFKELN